MLFLAKTAISLALYAAANGLSYHPATISMCKGEESQEFQVSYYKSEYDKTRNEYIVRFIDNKDNTFHMVKPNDYDQIVIENRKMK